MADITIRFACQHPTVGIDKDASEDVIAALSCPECGDRRVARAFTRAPRIIARDCDQTKDLGPLVTHAS